MHGLMPKPNGITSSAAPKLQIAMPSLDSDPLDCQAAPNPNAGAVCCSPLALRHVSTTIGSTLRALHPTPFVCTPCGNRTLVALWRSGLAYGGSEIQ